ncbi:Glycine/sarcosine/betaine reductase complex component C subunit beta [subsurface metagenome]
MPEEEFYGMMKISDEFELLLLEESFLLEVASRLQDHPLISPEDIRKLGKGVSLEQIEGKLREEPAMPIYCQGDRLVGYCQRPRGGGAEEDPNLVPHILMENLVTRCSEGIPGLPSAT